MRRWLAQYVFVALPFLWAVEQSSNAQSALASIPEPIGNRSCQPDDKEQPSSPEISIAELNFSGARQMSVAEQNEIAASLKQRTYSAPLDGATSEILERAKAAWQERGYFRAEVNGEARILTSNPTNQRIAVTVQVDEGQQYRLGKITFKHNGAITNTEVLRALFPIDKGEVFNREKIGTGLENMRKAYGEIGYINFTSIPNTKFDDGEKLIDLEIEVDEGKQFYVSSVNFLGLDEPTRQELSKDPLLQRGHIYNGRLFELFLLRHAALYSECGCGYDRRLDEQRGTVAFTFDFRQCSTE